MTNIEKIAPIFNAALASDELAASVVARMETAIGYSEIDQEELELSLELYSGARFYGFSDQGFALVKVLKEILEEGEGGESFSELLEAGEADFSVDLLIDGDVKYFSVNTGHRCDDGLHVAAVDAFVPDFPWMEEGSHIVEEDSLWDSGFGHEARRDIAEREETLAANLSHSA
jgi:hypothetical protein